MYLISGVEIHVSPCLNAALMRMCVGESSSHIHRLANSVYSRYLVFFSFAHVAQFFDSSEEAEWAVEVMRSSGLPVAVTMCIGPDGDINDVPSGACAVKLARAGRVRGCLAANT